METKQKQVRMYESVWRVIADYKKIMNISEALDGDEVDELCETIKDIINRNEGNYGKGEGLDVCGGCGEVVMEGEATVKGESRHAVCS